MENLIDIASAKYPRVTKLFLFLFSGGMGAVTNIGLLRILEHYFGVYYLIAGAISFVCSVFVSFGLQRKLTFKHSTVVYTHKQFTTFVIIALVNLGLSELLLFICVDKFGFHYVVGQIIGSAIVAIWSYFAYKIWVFKV